MCGRLALRFSCSSSLLGLRWETGDQGRPQSPNMEVATVLYNLSTSHDTQGLVRWKGSHTQDFGQSRGSGGAADAWVGRGGLTWFGTSACSPSTIPDSICNSNRTSSWKYLSRHGRLRFTSLQGLEGGLLHHGNCPWLACLLCVLFQNNLLKTSDILHSPPHTVIIVPWTSDLKQKHICCATTKLLPPCCPLYLQGRAFASVSKSEPLSFNFTWTDGVIPLILHLVG